MGEDVLGGFLFWQERNHILRTWQEEPSALETPGNSSPTAAGRPALAKLVRAYPAAAGLQGDEALEAHFFSNLHLQVLL